MYTAPRRSWDEYDGPDGARLDFSGQFFDWRHENNRNKYRARTNIDIYIYINNIRGHRVPSRSRIKLCDI